jgi:plastocyanin
MRTPLFKNLLLVGSFAALGLSAQATVHNIAVTDFDFTPAGGINAQVGDTIIWSWGSGSHTTTSASIPSGAATWDEPITSTSTTFAYVPTVAGTYGYVCTPHASMGMIGSFTVTGSSTSVSNTPAVAYTMSPNPASSELSIKSQKDVQSVSLFDMAGRFVRVMNPVSQTSSEKVYNVQDLTPGMYLLQVKAGAAVSTEKLLIAR